MVYNEYVDSGWILLDSARNLYYRKIRSTVWVRGTIRTVDNQKQIGVLPIAYRPKSLHYICPYATNVGNFAIAAISNSGPITVSSSLDIQFFTSFTTD